MLDELVVHNLGVLADVTIEPGPGLTVVTGETGAGKTLLVGALGVLLGGGLDQDRIGPSDDEVSVSARFAGDDVDLAVRTRLARGGRTRSYLDGAVAAAAEVAEAVAARVDVVAQHDALSLRREAAVRSMVDAALDGDGRRAAEAYRTAWEELSALRARRESLGGDHRALLRELELARHEADEIAAADLRPDEVEDLTGLVGRLSNAQDLTESAREIDAALEDATDRLGAAVAAARAMSRLDATFGLGARIESLAVEVADLAGDLRSYREGLVADPSELETASARLARIGDLRRRYGSDVEAVLEYGRRAAARAGEIESLLADAEAIEGQLADAEDAVGDRGRILTAARRAAADRLATAAVGHLRELGFGDPVLAFTIEPREPASHGADGIGLAFASDRRLGAGPVTKTASGGELSRIVLALRLAGGVGEAPVVVFDEVDTGIGGATGLALGAKLKEVAADAQVLCVTHLPQVAAHADAHLVVERDGPIATVRTVSGDERVAELTRMLSGLPDSDQGREHARELLAAAEGA